MLTVKQALQMMKRYGLVKDRINHCIGVSRYAYALACRIRDRHPGLGICTRKVRVAALLHDIGRSSQGDHEINSVEILKREGHPELADIVMHGTLYEIEKLRGNDNPQFLPKNIENKIVAYADVRFRLEEVSIEERFDEVLRRRKDEHEKIASVKMAMTRFKQMERELLALAEPASF